LTAENIVTITSKPTFTKLILRVYLRGTENKAERTFVLSTIYIICGIQTRWQVDENCYASINVTFCLFKYVISVRQDLVAASYAYHWLLSFVEAQYLGLFHFRELSLCSLNSVDSCALANCIKLRVSGLVYFRRRAENDGPVHDAAKPQKHVHDVRSYGVEQPRSIAILVTVSLPLCHTVIHHP